MKIVGVFAVGVVIAVAAYILFRERELREQQTKGYPASGNFAEGDLYSHLVLGVGPLFLTYDSTGRNSALWIVRPPEMFRKLEAAPLVRWNDPGRVVWSATGSTSADLLIEFAPETNHRVAVLRATCVRRSCRTTTQERGISNDAKLFVSDDGSVLLLGPATFTVFVSIADFMHGSAAQVTPRLSPPHKNELVAQSRDATLLLTNLESFSGEILEKGSHDLVHLAIGTNGMPAAVLLSDGLQIVVNDNLRTQLWDCPLNALKGTAACTVYTAPAGFPATSPASILSTECGIEIGRDGWTWLIRRNARTEDLLPAAGIVRCVAGETVTYRDRHIQYVTPGRQTITSERLTVQVQRGK